MNIIHVLKKNKDYKRVYSFGKSLANRHLVLFFLANNLGICRFGFTASKKVGNAVIRNRIRRLFKEACRINLKRFPAGFDFVLLARRNIVGQKYQAVEESLLKLLKNTKYYRG
ncbi:MAG: Ribonuclease P protein component [Pelotomaculum sp. PtaU1.Bin035]|nr:MAG: Ribonuclease P protein component [Pelotomaculum sp. PtaU1.Bin035]